MDQKNISIVRPDSSDITVRNNKGNKGLLTISNDGGRIIEYGNDSMVLSGSIDSRHIHNLLHPDTSYLDLPGNICTELNILAVSPVPQELYHFKYHQWQALFSGAFLYGF